MSQSILLLAVKVVDAQLLLNISTVDRLDMID